MLVKHRVRMNVKLMIVFVAALGLLVGAHSVSAATNTATNVLKVSPVRNDVEINPGESKKVQTVVTNLTKNDITVKAIENDFVAGDENGTPSLILDENKFAPTHSLKRFMAPLEDVTIPAGKAKTIEVMIAVPKGTQAGGYFGAVRFAPVDPATGGQVNLSASVASLILLTVPGDATERVALTDFNVQQDGKSNTFFQTPKNLSVAFRMENKGNIQEGPFGTISVKNGDKVVYTAKFNENTPRDMILPDSARKWSVPLDKIGSFGKYEVIATFSYGKKNETINFTRSFWVVPQAMIIAAVIGVIVLILLIVGIIYFLRGYKKRILRKHGGLGSR